MITILDQFNREAKDLHHSLQVSGFTGPVIVVQDDGFLPDGVLSAYSYFCGFGDGVGKPLYFNQVPVQNFWEITGTSRDGEIWDYDVLRGKIFFAEPSYRRLVKAVDWMDRAGKVRYTDHYNRFGKLFARTSFNEQQVANTKSYYDSQGVEVIVENYLTADIILNWQGQTRLFPDKASFFRYFLEVLGLETNRVLYNSLSYPFFITYALQGPGEDILFWQEGLNGAIPGNMQLKLAKTSRNQRILVQDKATYQQMLDLLPEEQKSRISHLGMIYPDRRENRGSKNVLIVTNSDQIQHFDFLLDSLPDYHFHVAALTEMSSRLMQYGTRNQVTLYPNVRQDALTNLLETCDIYLDVNHGSEVEGIVRRAFEYNQAIFAFENTAHNRHLTLPENIVLFSQANKMIEGIKRFVDSPSDFIAKQRTGLGQETQVAYQKALGEEVEVNG